MRKQEQEQKRQRARDLLRAEVKPRQIAAQLGTSLHYIRNVRDELREDERVMAEALRHGEHAQPSSQTSSHYGPEHAP